MQNQKCTICLFAGLIKRNKVTKNIAIFLPFLSGHKEVEKKKLYNRLKQLFVNVKYPKKVNK